MNKLALIGGKEIKKYTIADKLWELISKNTKKNFVFEIIPINTRRDLEKFYIKFQNDREFLGFNIALPWKDKVAELIGQTSVINTVYKKRTTKIIGLNTDIIGIVEALNYLIGENSFSKILVIGAGGAGLATANFLSKKMKAQLYIYDINSIAKNSKFIFRINSLSDLQKNRYDLIINATPLGKFYNSVIESFSSPIDLNILQKISKKTTILQEMNYLPEKTLFLQLGDVLGLKVIPGLYMLVFQAFGSFEKYFGFKVNKKQSDKIILEMIKYIRQKEDNIFNIKTF